MISEMAIFSIKPKFSALIFSGAKTVELRRTFPRRISKGSRILFWESSPRKQLAGSALVESVVTEPIEQLWAAISRSAGVSREEFDEYFDGVEDGVAVFLTDPEEFHEKPQLSALKRTLGFRPPQSFRYVSRPELDYLRQTEVISDQTA